MTLEEMKKKVLSLIEEIDTENKSLTGDPDIENKMPYVINQIQYELSRIKKIPAYKEIEVKKGDLIDFSKIDNGYDIYQLDSVNGIEYNLKADGTMIKALEDGVLEIDYFRYPPKINEKTKDNFEIELDADVLEVMPYGVAADLLKMDMISGYGRYFYERYQEMKNSIDPRRTSGLVQIVGGCDI